MEDQQPDPGDLTDESSVDEESPADDTDDAATDPAEDAAGGDGSEDDGDAGDDNDDNDDKNDDASVDGEEQPAEEAAVPRKRPAGRLLVAVAAASAMLFVGAGAFAGAAMQPYLADRAVVATKMEIVQTALKAINALWNYTPDSMGTLMDRASIYLSGDLEADYRKFVDTIAAANKQAQVTNSTEITGAAVESLDGSQAVVLVYTNTTATSEMQKTIPSLKYQSHRLFMRRDHNRWVITKMPTVTSLNLTPRL